MTQRRHFITHAAAVCVPALASLAAAAAPRAAAAAGLGDRLGGLLKGHPGKLSVVLVDTTGSIASEDWQLYERAMQALLAGTKPGDRIVLAAVADRPASKFIAHADHRLPGGGNTMQDEVRGRRTRQALQADFEALRQPKGAPARATCIVDAVAAAAEVLAQGRDAGQALQLLVLSDMIEESPVANFEREKVTPALTERVLGQLRQRKLLPTLAGVQVHVVGAAGRSAEHMAQVKAFWLAFFAATGAQVGSYGRAPLTSFT
jgi:hypothetical protein